MTWDVMNRTAVLLGYAFMLGVVGLALAVVYAFADEARRSYRQVRRIERIVLGKGKRAPWRSFLRRWRSEYLASYSSLGVGGFKLPYDTRKPITRDW